MAAFADADARAVSPVSAAGAERTFGHGNDGARGALRQGRPLARLGTTWAVTASRASVSSGQALSNAL